MFTEMKDRGGLERAAVCARAPFVGTRRRELGPTREAQGVSSSPRRPVRLAPSQPRLRSGNRREIPAPKRFVDFTLALLGLTLGFPVLLLIGIVIVLESRGSMLYSQERV